MFTLDQINRIHDKLGKAATLPQYLQALKVIGVDSCDSLITDGHSEYSGKSHGVVSPAAREGFRIADVSNRQDFLKHLDLHRQGKPGNVERPGRYRHREMDV